jgi:hypothetical protein
VLARRGVAVALERSTERPLSAAETKSLLRSVDTVLLLRGTALRELPAKRVKPDDLRGPTGKIRAPLVRVGRFLLAGFRLEALERLLADSTEPGKSDSPRARARFAGARVRRVAAPELAASSPAERERSKRAPQSARPSASSKKA